MRTPREQILEKLVERLTGYNAYLLKAINSESIIKAVTEGVRKSFESEIALLEKEIAEDKII